MYWNEDVNFNEQTEETKEAVYEALGHSPIEEKQEPCGEGFTRTLWETYQVDDLQIKVSYIYTNAADSREWAALDNIIIQKSTSADNGNE